MVRYRDDPLSPTHSGFTCNHTDPLSCLRHILDMLALLSLSSLDKEGGKGSVVVEKDHSCGKPQILE